MKYEQEYTIDLLIKNFRNSIDNNKIINDKIYNTIILLDFISSYNNIIIKSNKFNYIKTIKNQYTDFRYLSLCDNYIYAKKYNSNLEYYDTTVRLNIKDPLNPELDKDFYIEYGIGSHNMYFFKTKTNNIKSIGGMHFGYDWYNYMKNKDAYVYNKYKKYNDNISFIDGKKYGVIASNLKYMYNCVEPCPYYANGLHLFSLNKNILKCENNNLPIIINKMLKIKI